MHTANLTTSSSEICTEHIEPNSFLPEFRRALFPRPRLQVVFEWPVNVEEGVRNTHGNVEKAFVGLSVGGVHIGKILWGTRVHNDTEKIVNAQERCKSIGLTVKVVGLPTSVAQEAIAKTEAARLKAAHLKTLKAVEQSAQLERVQVNTLTRIILSYYATR